MLTGLFLLGFLSGSPNLDISPKCPTLAEGERREHCYWESLSTNTSCPTGYHKKIDAIGTWCCIYSNTSVSFASTNGEAILLYRGRLFLI